VRAQNLRTARPVNKNYRLLNILRNADVNKVGRPSSAVAELLYNTLHYSVIQSIKDEPALAGRKLTGMQRRLDEGWPLAPVWNTQNHLSPKASNIHPVKR